MSLSLEQLRSALADTAEDPAGEAQRASARLAGVRRTVRTRRLRRTGAVSTALAGLAVAGLLVTTGAVRANHTQPPAGSTNPTVHGLPLYAHGGKQIGSAQTRLQPGLNHLFTATATSYELTLAQWCDGGDVEDGITIVVNGHDTIGGGCGPRGSRGVTSGSGGYTLVEQERYWKGNGVVLGQQFTVDVRVSAPLKSVATQAVAVYQRVPLATYPLPKAPAQLLLHPGFGHGAVDPRPVRFPDGGVNGTWTETFAYDDKLEVGGVTTAPGQIEVSVDGRVVTGQISWTYDESGFTLPLSPEQLRTAGVPVPEEGRPLRVTVTIARFTAPTWAVDVGVGTGSLHVG